MSFDPALAWDSLPALLDGAGMTVFITLTVMLVGGAMGFGMVFVRLSRHRALAAVGAVYVALFRGAPSIVLLYLIYAGLAQLPAVRDSVLWIAFQHPMFCAILGLGLNHSAYVVEILRGGLAAVPPGLVESAQALGLSPRLVLFKVKLPIAIRYGLKAYQNEVLIFMKSTVAVSAITIADLAAAANEIFSMTYDPFTPLLTAGAMYWVMTNLMRLALEALDRRLNRHLRLAEAAERRTAPAAGPPVFRRAALDPAAGPAGGAE